MQVKVEVLEGLNRKINVQVPSSEIESEVLSGLKKAQKTAKIDGFRKGKVPMNIIKQRYEAAVRQDVLGKLVESSYSEAIKQEKVIPASQPNVTPISGWNSGEDFIYDAEVEIVPEFDVKGVDSLTVEKPIVEIGEADIQMMIDRLRKQVATWEESKEASIDGDRVTVDFKGLIDGETFEGGSGENMPVLLGAKQMLPEFEQALINVNTDDSVSTTVNFPKDYHGIEISGKSAIFEITVKKVEKPVLPEVDKEFIKKFGVADGDLEKFKSSISDNMSRELKGGIQRKIQQQVMSHLVDANEIMIPESMVKQEKDRMAHEQNLDKQIEDQAKREEIIESQFDAPARRRVLLGLIMSKLFESEKIMPDAKRVEKHIEALSKTYEDPQQVKDYYQKNPNALETLYAQVMEEQLIEQLLEKAKVTEKPSSFDEVMNQR